MSSWTVPVVPPSPQGDTVRQILSAVGTHGPLTSAQVRTHMHTTSAAGVRSALCRLISTGHLSSSTVREGGRPVACYALATPRVPRGGPRVEEEYRPEPWLNPIRRRALGLPAAAAPLTELRRHAPDYGASKLRPAPPQPPLSDVPTV